MFSLFFVTTCTLSRFFYKNVLLKDRALGLILGCAVGDAKGIPFENQTRDQIQLKLTQIDQNVPFIVCGDENPYIPKGYGPGMWTDDTQLSLAMMRSLIKENKINMEVVAEEHVKEYQRRLMGWGGTREAIKRLLDKTHTFKNSGNPATGNGVLMKLAPLSYFYANRNYSFEEEKKEVEILCVMTHNTPTAIVTSICFSFFTKKIFQNPSVLSSKEKLKELLIETIKLTQKLDNEYIQNDSKELSMTKVAPKLEELLSNFDKLDKDDVLIRISNGGTFYCLNSMIMVFGIILSSSKSFNDIIRAAYIGGDTDSNASMVGAILGGCIGSKLIPNEYLLKLSEYDEVLKTGNQFSELF